MNNKTLKDPLKSILKQQTKKVQRKGENRKVAKKYPSTSSSRRVENTR